MIDLDLLESSLREDTTLVSIMTANNEIGVIQDIAKIGELCRSRNIFFHTDSAQAIGKIPLDVEAMNVDLMSLTAHKIYGVKGIGALYVRSKNPRVRLASQLQGGGQENGFRSGTLYTPQIVAFAEAVKIALGELAPENDRLRKLRNHLWQGLQSLDGIHLNGDWEQRLHGNLNISIEGVNGASLLLALQSKIAISSGSACSSGNTKPSHVLKALGRDDRLARASLRFGIGRFNTLEEIEKTIDVVTSTIVDLRNG